MEHGIQIPKAQQDERNTQQEIFENKLNASPQMPTLTVIHNHPDIPTRRDEAKVSLPSIRRRYESDSRSDEHGTVNLHGLHIERSEPFQHSTKHQQQNKEVSRQKLTAGFTSVEDNVYIPGLLKYLNTPVLKQPSRIQPVSTYKRQE